jgi:hypothetical protein
MPWTALEPDLPTILAAAPAPLEPLARGEIPAIVIRGAFPPHSCQAVIDLLLAEKLIFESSQTREIDAAAIPAVSADRWTKAGTNPAASRRRRIDVGTSLGYLGDDKEAFLEHAARTQALFARLFQGRPDPVACIYEHLAALAPGKKVITACEPDGRKYGPAIFRVHYGGYTYRPHHDSVRNREHRTDYAVYKYPTQLAGVLCLQNATAHGRTAQGIMHRQFWNADIDPYLASGRFHEYASEHNVEHMQIDLEPGDLYFFNTGLIHEVPGVAGDLPRIVLATFIGYDENDQQTMVWS